MSEQIIELEEAARELQCAETTVRLMITQGLLPAIQPGKFYRMPRQAFWEAVNELARQQAAKQRALNKGEVSVLEEKRGRARPRELASDWLAKRTKRPPDC